MGGAAVDPPSPWLEPVRLGRGAEQEEEEESLISLSARPHKTDRTYQVRSPCVYVII